MDKLLSSQPGNSKGVFQREIPKYVTLVAKNILFYAFIADIKSKDVGVDKS